MEVSEQVRKHTSSSDTPPPAAPDASDTPAVPASPFARVMEMVIVKCLCGADDYKPVDTQRGFRMVLCRNCGLVYLNPRPVPEWYAEARPEAATIKPDEIARANRVMETVFASARRQLILRFPGAGRLLDASCGYGQFLEMMRGGGWHVEGLESDLTSAAVCKRRGLRIQKAELANAELERGRYDVVTLFHALETTADPVGGLRNAYAAIKPGGIIMVRFSNLTPLVRALKWLGVKTHLYDTPYRLYDFSPRSMTALLGRVGFENVRIEIGPPQRPASIQARLVANAGSQVGRMVQWISNDRYLLPGASKTAFAEKLV